MQVHGAAQGVGTIPRRGRLNALLAIAAIVVIAALVALLVWVVPLATSGVGAEDAIPRAGAGSAIIHDDAGNLNRYSYPLPPGKVASLNGPNAVSAVVHDDAGNMPPGAGSAVHDDAGNLKPH
jgi:hypothetical protein